MVSSQRGITSFRLTYLEILYKWSLQTINLSGGFSKAYPATYTVVRSPRNGLRAPHKLNSFFEN